MVPRSRDKSTRTLMRRRARLRCHVSQKSGVTVVPVRGSGVVEVSSYHSALAAPPKDFFVYFLTGRAAHALLALPPPPPPPPSERAVSSVLGDTLEAQQTSPWGRRRGARGSVSGCEVRKMIMDQRKNSRNQASKQPPRNNIVY